MSEDLTKKLPSSDSEKLSLILTIVQNLETRVHRLELRLDAFEKRFDALEKKVEERIYDTRPTWQKVVADIARLLEGQTQLFDNQRRMEETMLSEFGQTNKSLRDIFFQMSAVSDTMRPIQGSHKDFDLRIRELEAQHQKPTNSST